jgi:hypothetical protein
VLLVLAVAGALGFAQPVCAAKKVALKEARIYIEYNHTDNDLGFHIFLDGEDWKCLKIISPTGRTIFEVEGKGPYAQLGLTELFFEGAEPSLDDVPLAELLAMFPQGKYRFTGKTVDGKDVVGSAVLTHRIPAAPVITAPANGAVVNANTPVVIAWQPVPDPQGSSIIGYQVIVGDFSVTLPASKTQVTVPPEFLETGTEYEFEVLAIEVGGNQTISVSSFATAP